MNQQQRPDALEELLRVLPAAAVAFSGGVDSAYLLWAARAAGVRLRAYFVKTPFQPRFELEDAVRLCRALAVPLTVVPLDVLAQEAVAQNGPDRCYHCKRAMFTALRAAALRDGFDTVLDGTNASDDAADRPGMRALQELQVLSPLRLAGLSKDEVRRRSRAAGLFTWDKPAYACLATRVSAGTAITRELLETTEAAEGFLAALGFSDFRVRWEAGAARLQLKEAQLPLLLAHRTEILARLRPHYRAVLLDLEGRG